MIEKNPIFQVSLVKKSMIVEITDGAVICVAYLDKKRKIKINFNTKKKKTALITASPADAGRYYINLNKTIYKNNQETRHKVWSKSVYYPLRWKIKWKFKKFKYRGKGFKIKKYNKLGKITFKMGKSHWTKALFNKKVIVVKRTKKNTYCCITTKFDSLNNLDKILKKAKGINKYTKRGVRLSRQIVKKRFGKISQASSVYK